MNQIAVKVMQTRTSLGTDGSVCQSAAMAIVLEFPTCITAIEFSPKADTLVNLVRSSPVTLLLLSLGHIGAAHVRPELYLWLALNAVKHGWLYWWAWLSHTPPSSAALTWIAAINRALIAYLIFLRSPVYSAIFVASYGVSWLLKRRGGWVAFLCAVVSGIATMLALIVLEPFPDVCLILVLVSTCTVVYK